jgi:hypothetical protein
MTVSDVAGDNLDFVQSRNILQPSPEIEGVILGQRRYLRSGVQQMFDQVGADESISPRYQNAFALKVHLAELSPRFLFRSLNCVDDVFQTLLMAVTFRKAH